MKTVRILLASPLLWGFVALILFLVGLAPWAFPGEGVSFMAQTLGVLPAADQSHPLARIFFGALGACFPTASAVVCMNAASAVFGALSVALVCAVVRGLFRLLANDEPRTLPHVPWAIAIAVPATALACLFAPAFFRAATHFQWQTFDLFLALAAALLVVRTALNGSAIRMGVAAGLIGLIAMESAELLLLTPFLTIGLIVGYFFARERLSIRSYLRALVLPAAIGFVLTCCVIGVTSPTFLKGIAAHGAGLAYDIVGFFKDGPWILMALFGLVPGLLATFVIGTAGANTRTPSSVVTVYSLLILSLVAALPIAVSPSALAPEWIDAYPLIPIVCVALGFGAACGALTLYALVRTPPEGVDRTFCRHIARKASFVVLPLALVVLIGGSLLMLRSKPRATDVNLPPAKAAVAAFDRGSVWSLLPAANVKTAQDLPREAADAILDAVGEDWLLVDGALDPYLALRAATRDKGPTILHVDDREALLKAFEEADFIKNIKEEDRENLRLWLRDFGFLAFLQAWSDLDSQAVYEHLAFLSPDFLAASRDPSKTNFAQRLFNNNLLPEGLIYRLAPTQQARRENLRVPEDLATAVPSLGKVLDISTGPMLNAFADDLRHRLSAAAVNTAFALTVSGEADAAKALLQKVHTFDPENLSALIFLHDLAVRGGDEPLRDRCEADLIAFYNRAREEKRILSFEEIRITQGNLPLQPLLQAFVVQYARNIRAQEAVSTLRRIAENVRNQSAALFQNPGQILAADLQAAANDPARRGEAIAKFNAILRNADAALASLDDPEAQKANANAQLPTREQLIEAKIEALRNLARLYLQSNDINGLRDAVLQGESLGNPDAFAFERALLHAVAGESEKAIQAIDRYLKAPRDKSDDNTRNDPTNRDDLDALTFLAALQISRGDLEAVRTGTLDRIKTVIEAKEKKRMEEAGRATTNNRDNYYLYVVQAQLALAEGNLKDAREAFLNAHKVRPENEPVRNAILELDLRLDDRVTLGVHAKDFLEYDPSFPFANYAMGSNALIDNRPQDAIGYLRRSIDQRSLSRMPYAPAAYNDLAEAYRRTNNWDEAINAANEAIRLAPGLAVAYETAASAYLGKGDLQNAKRFIDQAFVISQETAPNQPVDPRFILTRAKLLNEQGNATEAKKLLEEVRPRYNDLDAFSRADYDAFRAELGN